MTKDEFVEIHKRRLEEELTTLAEAEGLGGVVKVEISISPRILLNEMLTREFFSEQRIKESGLAIHGVATTISNSLVRMHVHNMAMYAFLHYVTVEDFIKQPSMGPKKVRVMVQMIRAAGLEIKDPKNRFPE